MYPYHPIPSPGYVRLAYIPVTASPMGSPAPDRPYEHYHSQQTMPPASPPSRHPSRRHSRKESFSSPQASGGWHSPTGYPTPAFFANTVPSPATMPQERQPYVSNIDRLREKTRRHTASGHGRDGDGYGHHQRHASMQTPPPRIIVDTSDEADDSQFYTYIKPRASHTKNKHGDPDPRFSYPQVYDDSSDSQPQRSRARRSSYSSKQQSPPVASKPKAKPVVRQVATPADAVRARIPAGYSTKNWDPTEEPIFLLGSVFDAYSLGKWIFDWTAFHHGAKTPLGEMAGDLWLLLINLGGKMKRTNECRPRIRGRDNRHMVDDFLKSGDRLWIRLEELLRACEGFMMKVAKKSGSTGSVKMGHSSGCAFVDSIFGRDRELRTTEGLMQGMRLWNHRFDSNCEKILERASAKKNED